MVNKLSRFIWISFGGLLTLMALGMALSAFLEVSPEEVKGIDAVNGLMYYRIGFYTLIILLWAPICSWFTKQGRSACVDLDEEQKAKLNEMRKEDTQYLRSLWWKVLLAFVVIETVLIQQLGF